jgi:superfamily II DNA or RNA helicase
MILVTHGPTYTTLNFNEATESYDRVLELIDNALRYKNKSAEFQVKNFVKKFGFYSSRYGTEWASNKLQELKDLVFEKCYEQDDANNINILGGLWPIVEDILKMSKKPYRVLDVVNRPDNSKKIPWHKEPPPMREWQKIAFERYINGERRSTIIAGTGSGKTSLALRVIRELGVKTVFCVPSAQILEQTYRTFKEHLGQRWVGKYGAGVKKVDYLITVATLQSLAKISGENPFVDVELVIFDEADLMPAKTFENVALKIFPNTWNRLSLTGTWMRNDGADIRLRGITYDPIYKYETSEGIQDGVLSRPRFVILQHEAIAPNIDDRLRNIQTNVMGNMALNRSIVALATKFVNQSKQVLILVPLKEYGEMLVSMIPGAVFVSGDDKKGVNQAVIDFNNKDVKCLIATTVLGRGSDLKTTDVLFNILCTASEPLNKQAIGRALRTTADKDRSLIFDIQTVDNPMLLRHSWLRIKKIYEPIGSVEFCKINTGG